MTATLLPRPHVRLARGEAARLAPAAVTLGALISILVVCVSLQPRILTTAGLSLVLSSVVPLVFAALAQMVMMSIGDIDLSVGSFMGLVTCVAATVLNTSPLLGAVLLIVLVIGYASIGALVQLRNVPALIATLGASFVWYGFGLLLLPTPGGLAPTFLFDYEAWTPPVIPAPLVTMIGITAAVWYLMQRTKTGIRFRALGSNPTALSRAGGTILRTRMIAYAVTGLLGVLGGLTLTAEIGGGDITSAGGYTLVSVAAVILGGGTFTGGRAVAWGALFGAVTLGMVTVLLSLLDLPSTVQPAIQGGIVFAALAGRLLVEKVVRR